MILFSRCSSLNRTSLLGPMATSILLQILWLVANLAIRGGWRNYSMVYLGSAVVVSQHRVSVEGKSLGLTETHLSWKFGGEAGGSALL